MTKTVLISGAGIAGLTTAYWLHRHGFTPTVVERAPALRPGGYKIDIRGAALTVVERMGVLDAIRAHKTDVRTGSVVDTRGRRAAAMDGDTFGGRAHGDAEILRGDLARILHDLTKDDVDYRFGDSITDLTETGDGVTVTFARGDVRHYDFVIGADGLHSTTRDLAFEPGEHVRDLGYRVAVYSTPNTLGLDREELTYVAPGRTALTYSTAGDPGAKAMFLFESTADAREPLAQQRILAEAYAGEGWAVPDLLAALPDALDFYFDALSQVHLDTWSRGRIGLVGDAAYAASTASGQGTSLALVGAYVLAGELATAGDETGFIAYEHRLRAFVTENQKLGPANIKRMVLHTKAQVRMSMAMLRLVNRLPGKDAVLAKAMAPLHRAANAITLGDYDIATKVVGEEVSDRG